MDKITKKLVVIEHHGSISEMGGISGPILNPCYVDIKILNKMLNRHRLVKEVNPANPKERIVLNLRNLCTKNFPDVPKKEKLHVATAPKAKEPVKEPAKETAPAPKKEDTSMVTPKVVKQETSDFVKK